MDKKGIRLILIILIVLIVTIIITAINRQSASDDGVVTIGYCADNLVIERWKRDQEIFKEKAELEGVNVIFKNANENNATQVKQIEELIGVVDVLVVIPYDKDGLTEVINEAIRSGIKVISYDRLINNTKLDAYISFDNVKVGELMAEALTTVVPNGNYVIIKGSPDDNNSEMFSKGYNNILKPYIIRGEINVVREGYAEMWREEPAYNIISETLSKGIKIDAIISANDRLAEAAIRALAENGLAGKVYVAGHDADVSACQRIVEGTQHITIYKPIKEIAERAVELAISLAQGEAVNTQETINNGMYEVPFVKLDVVPVLIDNLESTVIKDGFHKYEDIFRD